MNVMDVVSTCASGTPIRVHSRCTKVTVAGETGGRRGAELERRLKIERMDTQRALSITSLWKAHELYIECF